MIDFTQYDAITFDCYGTLVDWETGILQALQSLLCTHTIHLDDEQVLTLYSEVESQQETGDYQRYRDVLRGVVRKFGQRLGFTPSAAEQDQLPNSVQNWLPFPDTIAALQQLKQHYKLVIISNTDDDLFAATAQHLQVEFDHVITAEQAKSYKPSLNNFKLAFERIGLPPDRILHTAASIYHDIIPATALGMTTVWVNRRSGKSGSGAAREASGQPTLEVADLQTLAALANDAAKSSKR